MSLTYSASAYAVPSMADHWRFECVPYGYNKKIMQKAQKNSGRGGPGLLNLACVQSALEIAQFQAQSIKFQENNGAGKAPILDNRKSQNLLKKATAKLQAAFKRNSNNPNIAYWNGYALGLIQDGWAINRLDDVMRKSPKSSIADNAALAMAELYFDTKGPEESRSYYHKALKSREKLVTSYARYKLGWVDYIVGMQTKQKNRQKLAISSLARLSQSLTRQNGKLKALGKKIREDVLDLIVDFGDLEEAKRILKSVNASDVYATLLERMAYIKLEAQDIAGAYKLFSMVIKESPDNPENAQTSINLIGLAAQMNNVPLITKLVKIVISKYVYPKAKWRKKQDKRHLATTDALMEKTVFEYATVIDREGRDKNIPDYLTQASVIYKLFAKYFPKSKNLYDAKFFEAQIQDTKGNFKGAVESYNDLIKTDPKNKNTKSALDLLVTAAQNIFDADKKQYKFPPPGSMKRPMKLPEVRKIYADAIELYAKKIPSDENSALMLFTAAGIYYDFGNYREGNKRYFYFLKKHPNDPNSKVAAARIFEYFKMQKTDRQYIKIKKRIGRIASIKNSPDMAYYFSLPAPKEDEKSKKKNRSKRRKPKAELVSDSEAENAVETEQGNATNSQDKGVQDSGEEIDSDNTESDDEQENSDDSGDDYQEE